MVIDKKSIMKDFQKNEKDTGSTGVQVSILTAKIKLLTEHLKINKKDEHSRRGLLNMVNLRRKLLKYIKRKDLEGYKSLIGKLGIRK